MFCKMKNAAFSFLCIAFLITAKSLKAQPSVKTQQAPRIQELQWHALKTIAVGEKQLQLFSFEGAVYPRDFNTLPWLTVQKENSSSIEYTALIDEYTSSVLSDEEKNTLLKNKYQAGEEFISETSTGLMRKTSYTFVHICPIRFNKKTGDYEKLLSYSLKWLAGAQKQQATPASPNFASSSVLGNGTWYKISIAANGIYKIDKAFLTKLGINVATLNTNNLRIYGNGGKILPEKNSLPRYDDLNEIAISMVDGNDGVFDANDYILFYGSGTDQWSYSNASGPLKFNRIKNYYSDSSFYFITTDNGAAKHIANQAISTQTPNYNVSSYDDYAVHENDAVNLIKSGREMYGEYFDIATSYGVNFSFPNLVVGDTVKLISSIAGRNTLGTADFKLTYPSGTATISCSQTGSSYTDDIAKEAVNFTKYINNSTGNISLSYDKTTPAATGWLNYVLVNVRRQLSMSGDQLRFRDSRASGTGNISKFSVSSPLALTVWDITDPFNALNQSVNFSSGIVDYTLATDSLKEFIAFTGTGFLSPKAIGKIQNQNLHALQPVDYIVVTHPLFKQQAQKLAELHNSLDGLSYVVVTPDEIYNEFSSGVQDISAIRDFVRMLYKKATTANLPKYVLLFGDGSYDNFHRYSASNTNYMPTYQTYESLSFMGSYTSDDFFGFMDDNEGDFKNSDIVDVGVGRIPADNVSDAEGVLNKVQHYCKKDPGFDPYTVNSCTSSNQSSFGDWRNLLCFVADDANLSWETTFLNGSENYAATASAADKTFNIDKIYSDAYKQETTPGGERYPDVNDAINKRLEKGALILNYSGHGGELGWAHEAIIDVPQILNWKNINNMPMFLTATCEFSRHDDPARISAGEDVLLNPNGGGIGLLTTTRIAYASDADALCPKFFSNALVPMSNGKMPAMGDITRQTKFLAGAGYRHFTLLGDPALILAYPRQRVYTTEINQHPVTSNVNDSIAALQKVTVKGYVGDRNGNKLSSYNGVVYPAVFDKPVKYSTQGNDLGPTGVLDFMLQKNVLYKGKSIVNNGDFEFSFIVPKDISYQYGFGRISYYVQNGDVDGAGYYDKVVIGGSDPNAKPDITGPHVKLYMNDNHFVYGGTTNENPKLYAEVFDSSGINTVGNGIGHDLIAVLDANTSKQLVLNDYYQADLNSFQAGKIIYPFSGLSEGTHTLSTKVWDVQNNSSSAFTEFVVAPSSELALRHVLNYPNPFTTNTKFFIEHNQCCSNLNVEIQIFTVSGKIVKTISKTAVNEGFRTEGIEWDGKDDFGDKIGRGVYVYRVSVRDGKGKHTEKYEKLVILN